MGKEAKIYFKQRCDVASAEKLHETSEKRIGQVIGTVSANEGGVVQSKQTAVECLWQWVSFEARNGEITQGIISIFLTQFFWLESQNIFLKS